MARLSLRADSGRELGADADDRVSSRAGARPTDTRTLALGRMRTRGALLSAQSETSERVVEMLVAVRKRGSASPRPAGSGR